MKGEWQTQPPAEPGWYWWRQDDTCMPMVWECSGWPGRQLVFTPTAITFCADLGGQWWSEPIEVPE